MRTGEHSRRTEGSAALLLVLVVLVTGLTGCSLGKDQAPAEATSSTALAEEIQTVLARRAAAVRTGDMSRFIRSVAAGRRRLVEQQETYFLNVRELPLAQFRYVVPAEMTTTEDDGAIHAVVLLRMQIEGFDAAPVESPARYAFVRNARGALRISAVRDRKFEESRDIELAPWDLGRITVVEGDGVLGIFDQDSADAAYQIIASVEDGIEANRRTVPWSWTERVIVYALSDTRVLASLDNLPGGDPDRLDGVAFPVAAATGKGLASTRFMLHPRMIYRTGPIRDRLIRHELTHVALGRRDDKVPKWLSEGIADHVSVQPIATYQRTISRASVEAARGAVTNLPDNENFNGELSAANYGIAWYACEFIVASYGEETLWRLLGAMRAHGGTRAGDEQDVVLKRVLGIDGDQLARSAGKKILATFG